MTSIEMYRKILEEQIKKEKERLQKLLGKTPEELTFLSNVWESKEPDILKQASNTNQLDLVIALLLSSEDTKESFEQIREVLSKNKKLIEQATATRVEELLSLLNDIDELGYYDKIKYYLYPSEENFTLTNQVMARFLKHAVSFLGIEGFDAYYFFQSVERYPDFLDMLMCVKMLAEINERKNLLFKEVEKGTRLARKLTGMSSNDIKKDYDLNTIRKMIYNGRSYYDKQKQIDITAKKSYRRELTAYETLEENLSKLLSSGEIKNIKELLSRISNPEIRLNLLRLIYLHNSKTYQEIDNTLQSLSANQKTNYQALMHEYGIAPEKYDLELIMATPISTLRKILEALKNNGIENAAVVVAIIISTDEETTAFICNQISRGIISKELVESQTEIFAKDSEISKNFRKNIVYFTDKGLNPHYLRDDQTIFFTKPEILQENVACLERYNLLSSMKTGMAPQFLSFSNLDEAIDTLLELGYEEFLETDLSLLNYQSRFPRLRILKELNIPLESIEELKKTLTTDKFILQDEDIDSYLYNACEYKGKNKDDVPKLYGIDSLSDYSKTERVYNIGGILVSKNKVRKNITPDAPVQLETLIDAITQNMFLSDEEEASLEKTLRSIEPSKVYAKQ